MIWTPEQKRTITTNNSNLLISAAAGSGKTAVLVERIIHIIVNDKVDINKILIVTFTNAAAGEMRQRISNALINKIENNKANRDFFKKQLNLLNKSSISTIHSFCIDIVRKYFHIINLDPKFRIGDAAETAILKIDVLEELMEKEYEKSSEHFLGLVEMFGGNKDDRRLQELILDCYEFIQSQPYPYDWMHEKVEQFTMNYEDYERSIWIRTIIEQIKVKLNAADNIFKDAKKIVLEDNNFEGYLKAVNDDLIIINDLIFALNQGFSQFINEVNNVKHTRLKRLSNVDEEMQEKFKNLREEAKDIVKQIKKEVSNKDPESCFSELNEMYPYMKYFIKIISFFHKAYLEKKLEKGLLDFNDLEHYSLEILSNQEIAKEVREKYSYIFVDEYQDSNLVQETILNKIKRENNLFLVGDVKQSIYRFRQADPTLFLEKYHTFKKGENYLNQRIDLNKNFRSNKTIIDGINFIFKNIMSKYLGEIDYNEDSFLYYNNKFKEINGQKIELSILEKNKKDNEIKNINEKELDLMEDIEIEARAAADKIKNLIGQKIYDNKKECLRNIEYKDVVVLMRATSNWAQTYLETFISEGIPAYADFNTGFFETTEIKLFMSLLKIIDNKRQDIPLLSVLRSPVFKFNVDELIKIRTESNKTNYYEALYEYIEKNNDNLKNKLLNFEVMISKWKKETRIMKMDEFIWKLMLDSGFYYYIIAMPGGNQRKANLDILLDRAKQFQSTSMKGLFNFIKFIDKLKASSGDMGTAKIMGENDNVVKIMSIHKSKGLEFPVVIVVGMGKHYNLRDTTAPILFHKDLGIGPKYVNLKLRRWSDSIARAAMKTKIKLECLSEEMRILYVACTRAKNNLILIGSLSDIEKSAKKWSKNMGALSIENGKNYLDWICPVLMYHKDGYKLRELAGFSCEKETLKDDSNWDINIINCSDILSKKLKTENIVNFKEFINTSNYNLDNFREIEKKLDWEYQFKDAVKIPSKMSVTQIKKLKARDLNKISTEIPSLIKRPKFLEGKKSISGSEKGTIIHFVMQHLNFNMVTNSYDIKRQLREMVFNELLKQEEIDIINVEKILSFFYSDLGKRILKSEKIYREVPFNLVCKASDVIEGLNDCSEELLVQGVIDLYFEENKELILIDYKTDYISDKNKADIINKYKIQLAYYKKALENIKKRKVKESYIFLFDIGEEIKI